MINISEKDKNISNSVKRKNWSIIKEDLSYFGLKYQDDEISQVISGDKKKLLEIIISIYEFTNELLRHFNLENSNNSKIQNEKEENKKNIPNEKIDIENIDINKNYNQCEYQLEFFIL